MKQVIIVSAVDKTGLIGNNGQLPWHRPDDLEHFKRVTTGRTIVMGRKTAISLGKPLKDRTNLVLTSQPETLPEGFIALSSTLDAVTYNNEDLYVIGGGEIYAAFIPLATRMIRTLIVGDHKGDVYFPRVDWLAWQNAEARILTTHPDGSTDYVFEYVRIEKYSGL